MTEQNRQVLVVDDDPVIGRLVGRLLGNQGYAVTTVETGTEALRHVSDGFHGVVILDVRLPDVEGPAVFRGIRQSAPDCPVIYLTGHASTDLALDTIREGAFEFVEKNLIFERLPDIVASAFRMLEATPGPDVSGEVGSFGGIVTQAREMKALFRSIQNAVDSTVSVLIHGESGTGKELVAKAIHRYGPRASGPFMAINCAGIPESLLEAELFGHERGAFTGAVSRKMGKFEAARGGTLLLDEVGEMHPMLQAKLLRVLQEGELQRLGGNETVKTDVRVVSATNRDLLAEVEQGQFRADLYYRLAVFTIHVPPLRDRAGDVSLLVDHFVQRFAAREGKKITGVDDRAMELLRMHSYPGNVRELENVVSYAVVSTRTDRISIPDLPPSFLHAMSRRRSEQATSSSAAQYLPQPSSPHDPAFPTLAEMERQHIERALEMSGGNKTLAAQMLGISRMTLYRKLREQEDGQA